MPGTVFQVGEQMVRPGFYFRVTNIGAAQSGTQPQGIVAVLFRSSWGPVATVENLASHDAATALFGSSGTVAAIEQAFLGGALKVKAIRTGENDGTAATITLVDTTAVTPIQAVQLTLSVGADGNSYSATVRDSLTDPTKRQCVIYNGQTAVQTFTFASGITGVGEPAALVVAITAVGLDWISATKLADGNKTLAVVAQSPFAGGADPTVDAAAISMALDALSTEDWDVLCTDSEDPSVHATIQAYIDNEWNNGKFGLCVVGEPTSVVLATRQTDATTLNDFLVAYVLNGFMDTSNNSIEGYLAAARVAGMVAAAPITSSMTHAIVTGATDVVGKLSNTDIIASEQAGAIVFTLNSNKQVQIDKGINSYVTTDANHDVGWKKIRRVKTRIYLMYSIAATWDPLVGQVNNDADGQSTLMGAAQAVINSMIRMGALTGGTVFLDPDSPPSGDSAWFKYAVDDVDSAEILYGTFGFEFAPPATASGS